MTYFGVKGCQISDKRECPKGYHPQWICPPNPMMKAPCRLMCVGDEAEKGEKSKEDPAKNR